MAIKIIEVIGVSSESMEEAVENAVEEVSKTIRNISGVDILGYTAKVEDGKIVSWSANVKIAFEVER
jgi:flavin-binding protein dodecin